MHSPRLSTGVALALLLPVFACDINTPVTASKLAFTVHPTSAVSTVAIAPAVQVSAQDDAGNIVTTFTGSVTLVVGTNPASGTLSGTATVAAVAGVATFSGLSLDKAGTGYTLAAGSTGLTGATSTPFDVVPGPVSVVVVTPAGIAITGGTQAYSAQARDAIGNVIVGKSITWTSLNPNVATINGSSGIATAAASGQVTVSASVDGVEGYGLLTVTTSSATPVNLWSEMTSGTTQELHAVWGNASNNFYAVGKNGTVLRFDGTSWTSMASGTSQDLYGAWGASATDVFVVGWLRHN